MHLCGKQFKEPDRDGDEAVCLSTQIKWLKSIHCQSKGKDKFGNSLSTCSHSEDFYWVFVIMPKTEPKLLCNRITNKEACFAKQRPRGRKRQRTWYSGTEYSAASLIQVPWVDGLGDSLGIYSFDRCRVGYGQPVEEEGPRAWQ